MKKTLIALSLAMALISTSAIACPTITPPPPQATQWLESTGAHIWFPNLKLAQQYAKTNKINPKYIEVYVLSSKHSTKRDGTKIYVINDIGIRKTK